MKTILLNSKSSEVNGTTINGVRKNIAVKVMFSALFIFLSMMFFRYDNITIRYNKKYVYIFYMFISLSEIIVIV